MSGGAYTLGGAEHAVSNTQRSGDVHACGTAAKTVMLQGTASGVGKSTLAIGMCRVLTQNGVHAMPFKAQNLSDNAHVLPDGRRMARSQAIAAEACGLAPHPDMNPVLLVPKRGGCEIFLHGESIGDTRDYPDQTALYKRLKTEALAAHERLAKQCDVIVAEGAGSPVELNLRGHDIVNMGFACAVQCPVLLVSDIRRGGVFAMVHGTLALLHPAERALVKGVIVNGFCGDPTSFAEGARQLAAVAHRPVLGVVPQLALQLEDEDDLPGAATKTKDGIAQGLPEGVSYAQHQAAQFDLLADALRKALDWTGLRECGL